MAGRYMALQSGPRRDETQSGASSEGQTAGFVSETKKVVGQGSSVFSLEETESDIFDFDNDVFGNVGLTSFTDTNPASSPNPIISNSSSSSTSHTTSFSTPTVRTVASSTIHSTTPTMTTLATHNSAKTNNSVKNTSRTSESQSTSPHTYDKLKSFTFKKRPSSQKRSATGSQFDPPAKRVGQSVSPAENCEDEELFDNDLLAAFISEPDEMEQSFNVASNRPSHSRDSSSTSSHRIQLTDSSLFKTPRSRPQRSRSNDAECSANPRDSSSQSHVLSTPRNRSTTASAHTPVGSASANNRVGSSVGQHTPRRSSLSSISSPLPLAPTSALSTPQCGHSVVPVRRRFPGPAGILPPLAAGQSLDGIVVQTPSLPTPAATPQMKTVLTTPSKFNSASAQSGGRDPLDFSQGPWITMLQDLDMDDEYSGPLLKFSIARAMKQASRQRLRNGKVTHLRVLLKSIVPACRNTSAILKDPTGEILCTIHQSVMEEHHQDLQPGAVLILRQVTVFSPVPRKHYLSITPDNIVIIYPSFASQTTSTTQRTICLTEVEKRYQDQAAKENSHQNSLSPPQPQPESELHTPQYLYQDTPTGPTRGLEPRGATSRPSAAPELQQDQHATSEGVHHLTQHQESAPSFFSNQLHEDEFDSIMECLESELDF